MTKKGQPYRKHGGSRSKVSEKPISDIVDQQLDDLHDESKAIRDFEKEEIILEDRLKALKKEFPNNINLKF